MKRREFLAALGGAAVVSTVNTTFGMNRPTTTSLYVKGLVMFDLDDSEVMRIGFPKAPGHQAILSILPVEGTPDVMTITGHGSLTTPALASSEPRVFVPELVRMREFYGPSIKSKVDQCPNVITIPYSAIHSVTTAEVSTARYTFVRADTGEEVRSFRPRQIADTIKIDLSSSSILELENGKISVPLATAREIRMQYAPDSLDGMNAYADHFHHYFSYVERPAALDFDVVPKKLGGGSSPAPRVGHHFMRAGWNTFCYPLAL